MNIQFIKSFSKGQITIPKEVRELLGIQDEFWLKLWTEDGKIIAEPVKQKVDKTLWRRQLLQMPQVNIDVDDLQANRSQMEKQIKTREV